MAEPGDACGFYRLVGFAGNVTRCDVAAAEGLLEQRLGGGGGLGVGAV